MKKIIILLALATIMLPSCKNLVPYTDALQSQRQWKTDELKNAQFYLSDDIILERTLTKDFPDAIVGKIIIKDGVKKEVVLLQKKLPVAFVETTPNGAYIIQCEKGEYKLTFGLNPNQSGQYVLLASDWKNHYGKVHYGGLEYFVSTEQSHAHLLIDLRKQREEENNFHRATGVKIKVNKN